MLNKPNVVIIPHWGLSGGAGFYIQDIIDILHVETDVFVAGHFATDYNTNIFSSRRIKVLSVLYLPAYEGVSVLKTIFHIMFSILRALFLILFFSKKCDSDKQANIIIFTSSIQSLAVPFARGLYPDAKIILMVQENVKLNKFFGHVVLRLLKKVDTVISISNAWKDHAKLNGLETFLFRNGYDPSFVDLTINLDPSFRSDLLYLGGCSKIKGFDIFCTALPLLLSRPDRRIVCLGTFDQKSINLLNDIYLNSNGHSELIIKGFVKDIRGYLRSTKLLVLPIGYPHFCRPAVEAGLFSKTFVISDFLGLEDFVLKNSNCKSFQPDNIIEFIDAIELLLGDDFLRRSLELENSQIASKFIRSENQKLMFIHEVFN